MPKKTEQSRKMDPEMHVLTRYIGIRHRVKMTKDGEVRPTEIAMITASSDPVVIELKSESDELDFVNGRLPVKWRKPAPDEDLSDFAPHHIQRSKKTKEVTKVPAAYDGLRSGDIVAMMLGGSGDYLAYAMVRRCLDLEHSRVMRVPGYVMKEYRSEDKEHDSVHLARLAIERPEVFYEVSPRDLQIIDVRLKFRARIDAMKDRIACEQRLLQASRGQMFCDASGLNPERTLEELYQELKASDPILQAVAKDEHRRERELVKALEGLDVYQKLFAPVKGMGPRIASRIICEIMDIRAYETEAKLKAKLGCHVLRGGKYADVPPEKQFPRRRRGQTANWSNEGRKALYLLADQFNRRPDTKWGQTLLWYKARFRAKHPEVVVVNGKKRYNDAHILKMAQWRTVTKFVEFLHRDWTRLVETGDLAAEKSYLIRERPAASASA